MSKAIMSSAQSSLEWTINIFRAGEQTELHFICFYFDNFKLTFRFFCFGGKQKIEGFSTRYNDTNKLEKQASICFEYLCVKKKEVKKRIH